MHSNLSILHIAQESIGGVRKHIHEIINNLGSDFNFYYISSKNADSKFFEDLNSPSFSKVTYTPLNISKKFTLSDFSNIYHLIKFVKKNQIHVIHGHGSKGGLYARLTGIFTGCNVVYTPHGGAVHNAYSLGMNIFIVLVESFLSFFTDLYIFESNYTKNNFYSKFYVNRTNFQVIKNCCVPPEKLILDRNFSSKVINIFVIGLIRYEKGQDLSLDIIHELRNNLNFKFRLHFIGPCPDQKFHKLLLGKINKLNIDAIFHGEVVDPWVFFSPNSLLLVPSRFESFGYVALEAILRGIPVISSDVGGLKEVLGSDYQFLYSVDSSLNGATKVVEYISLPQDQLNNHLILYRNRATQIFNCDSSMLILSKAYRDVSRF